MVQVQSQKWMNCSSAQKTKICTQNSRTNCHIVTVGPTAIFAHINCDSWSNIFLIHVIPARAASRVPSCRPPSLWRQLSSSAERSLELRVMFSNITGSSGAKAAGGGAGREHVGTVHKKNILHQQHPGWVWREIPCKMSLRTDNTGTEMGGNNNKTWQNKGQKTTENGQKNKGRCMSNCH